MKQVKWGIIGAGDVCERKSGPPLYKVENSVLTAVHRRNVAAGKDFAGRHGDARYIKDPDDLYNADDIDAIYVATPHDLHYENTIRALKAGKHVLVEKPMATSAADCTEMIDAARNAEKSLGVAYYRRGYPSIQAVKQLIDDGEIGQIESVSINGEFPTSHRLDLVHYLIGDIKRVKATKASSGIYSPEDVTSKIVAESVSGVNIAMVYGWVETGMPEALRVTGNGGELYLQDLKAGEITVKKGGATAQTPVSGLPYTHWGLVDNYVRHLLDGTELLCDGEAGRRSTVILDALLSVEPGSDWAEIVY